ncbi:MAG: hypothetical protein AB1426_11300 [Bacillota bacterium]
MLSRGNRLKLVAVSLLVVAVILGVCSVAAQLATVCLPQTRK